jgi:hypothetical protein
MKHGTVSVALVIFLLCSLLFLPLNAPAADARGPGVDTVRCEEMIRFGKQAYDRARYLDAKEYFRKAVQADPSSKAAWRHYDLSIIYALAEKVNKNTGLIAPDSSPNTAAASPATPPTVQTPPSASAPAAAPPAAEAPAPAASETAPPPAIAPVSPSPPPEPAGGKKPKSKIEEDEGC